MKNLTTPANRLASAPAKTSAQTLECVIKVRNVNVQFGTTKVLENLDVDVHRGEILGFVGGSGTGKSVLLRTILGLNPAVSGDIELLGVDYNRASDAERLAVDQQLGVLFQQGALFSSLTVRENIQLPMREYLDLPENLLDELTALKLELVGLPQNATHKMPSELSGGMVKRVALARALALDPKIVFLDEPTSGLDPIGAADFDELIMTLRDTLGLSVYMVTHDLDSLYTACDRIAVLGQKRVLINDSLSEVLKFDDPWIKQYFAGKRARSIKKPS